MTQFRPRKPRKETKIMAFGIKEVNEVVIAAMEANLETRKGLRDLFIKHGLSAEGLEEMNQEIERQELQIKAATAGIKTPTMGKITGTKIKTVR